MRATMELWNLYRSTPNWLRRRSVGEYSARHKVAMHSGQPGKPGRAEVSRMASSARGGHSGPGTQKITIVIRGEETKVEVTSAGGGPRAGDAGRAKVRSFASRWWPRFRHLGGLLVGIASVLGAGVAIWAMVR